MSPVPAASAHTHHPCMSNFWSSSGYWRSGSSDSERNSPSPPGNVRETSISSLDESEASNMSKEETVGKKQGSKKTSAKSKDTVSKVSAKSKEGKKGGRGGKKKGEKGKEGLNLSKEGVLAGKITKATLRIISKELGNTKK